MVIFYATPHIKIESEAPRKKALRNIFCVRGGKAKRGKVLKYSYSYVEQAKLIGQKSTVKILSD